jgi:hypothetical protein
MIGFEPITKEVVPVGVVQEPATGLQTPRTTVPPKPVGENGSDGEDVCGTTIVSAMLELFTTLTAMFGSIVKVFPLTMPTLVRTAGSAPVTNEEPVNTIV